MEEGGLDEVLWIPYSLPPHKADPPVASSEDRLALCRAAVAALPRARVLDLEVLRGGVSYAVETLRALGEDPNYATARLHLILGEDEAASITEWREAEEIVRRARILGFRRGGFRSAGAKPVPPGATIRWISAPRLEISSRWIRDRLASGRTAGPLLPAGLEEEIRSRGLYRSAVRA